ncbi:hypothetical protein ACFYXM_24140 [Streptomyces sp. NPDC002476]|uniref:hypothetical protein n=1 Tax=Streptomyces sp. NPDC002476 TaxID=3364648 RepID=UPI0036881B31
MPHLTTAAPVVDDALLAAAHPAPWTARLHPVPPRDLLVQLRAPTRLLNRRARRGGLDRGRLVEARARLPRSDLGFLARPETAGLGRCLNQLLHPRRAPAWAVLNSTDVAPQLEGEFYRVKVTCC